MKGFPKSFKERCLLEYNVTMIAQAILIIKDIVAIIQHVVCKAQWVTFMKCLVSTRGRSEGLRDPISLPGTGQTDTLLLHYVLSVLQCHPFGCVLSVCNVFRFSRFAKRSKRCEIGACSKVRCVPSVWGTRMRAIKHYRGSYTGVCGSVPFAAFGET